MGSLLARDVSAALVKKGFEKRESHHTYFHFKYEGRDVGVNTKISQGEKEIRDTLITLMRRQLRLETTAQFREFVECPLTLQKYLDILKGRGVIPIK